MKPDPVAAQAYLYGFPLLLMDAAARRGTGSAGAVLNRFTHCFDLAETSLGGVVLPSRDLASSVAWLDLRRAPVILTSLPTNSYYVMSLIDAWSNVFATLGTRAAGNAENRFAIVGPNWTGSIPSNCTRVCAPTNLACIVVQTSVEELLQTLALASLDERYRLEPSGSESPGLEPASVLSDVDALSAEEAFTRIRELMIDNPAARSDASAIDALDALRGHEASAASANAAAQARRQIDEIPDTEQGGWALDTGTGRYGTDYLRRARGARHNFLASTAHDVLCVQARSDTHNLRLTGTKDYVLHFDPWDEPPARAFWSLCAFDNERRFTTNAAVPTTIDSREPLARRSNRSLDLYLAHDQPIDDRVQNWLACPQSEFTLALRLYWPRQAALSGVWMPPNIAALSR